MTLHNDTSSFSKNTATGKVVNVMVVDDSAIVRGIIKRTIEEDEDLQVSCVAHNGVEAVDKVGKEDIDVVILDIEMPEMDGIEALPKMLEKKKDLIVIMASTLTLRNADISIKALVLGAKDYVPKPTTSQDQSTIDEFKTELTRKIKSLSRHLIKARKPIVSVPTTQNSSSLSESYSTRSMPVAFFPKALAIGSSTGGPQALLNIFQCLPKINLPIFITQHMPASFTAMLAEHLNKASSTIEVKEARAGEPVTAGVAYVAPGGYHMAVTKNTAGATVIALNQEPPEHFCRPSLNPLFRSVADTYDGKVLGVVLTGMGDDGIEGAKYLVEDKKGVLISQNRETSVVWGMPRAIAEAGLSSAILPLEEIAGNIAQITGSALARTGVRG